MAGEQPSRLVVVLDVNPLHWGKLDVEQSFKFSQCVDSVCVFLNAYMMINNRNELAVLASHPLENCFVYPTPLKEPDTQNGDFRYELFAKVDQAIVDGIKEMIERLTPSDQVIADGCLTMMAGGLAKSLCYINKRNQDSPAEIKMQSRILVIKASPDAPSQYMATMNCIFAAQKNGIPIDSCIIGKDSGYQQQASDITDGTYLKILEPKALLQYLMWVFLPDTSVRDKLILPSHSLIDYRAACFCHRKLVEVGYVCSVCLSIFCQFNPVCLTCNTRFKVPGLGMNRGKKKKLP